MICSVTGECRFINEHLKIWNTYTGCAVEH